MDFKWIYSCGKEPPEKGTFKYYQWVKKNLKKSRNVSYYKKDKQYKKDPCEDATLRKRKQRELEKEGIGNEIHRKELQNLRAKKYREKLKSDNIQQDIEFKNRMQKSRLIKKLKSALPQSPHQRLGVSKGYLTSRSPTVKTLGKCKIFETPKDNKERNSAESLIEDVSTILDNTKSKRTSQSKLCRKLIFSTVCGENIQKNNMKNTLAKKLGVKRTHLAAGIRTRKQILTTDAGWQITLRKTRNNNIPDTHKKIAYDYWLKAGNSRPTGNKKDIKRERLDTNVYISHMIQVLEKSQTEIYNDFREVYPEIKMSQSTFERLKPFYVRPVRSTDRNTCLCRYHVEIKSVLDSCMRERKKILERENNPVLSSRYPIFRNINDVVTSTLCNKADREDNHDISIKSLIFVTLN